MQQEVKNIVEDKPSVSPNDTFRKTVKLDDQPGEVFELLRTQVTTIFRNAMELNEKVANQLKEDFTAMYEDHKHTKEGVLLLKLFSNMYSKGSIDVVALYTTISDSDCTDDEKGWASVNELYHIKHNKSEEDAKKVGKIGEMLAEDYLTKKYKGCDVNWLHDDSELGLPYDFVVLKEDKVIQHFEVKITGVSEKYWFKLSPKQIKCAIDKGKLYSVIFIKVKEDSSADVYEVQEPLSKLSELQPILRMQKV